MEDSKPLCVNSEIPRALLPSALALVQVALSLGGAEPFVPVQWALLCLCREAACSRGFKIALCLAWCCNIAETGTYFCV